jgi:hypothetical protein
MKERQEVSNSHVSAKDGDKFVVQSSTLGHGSSRGEKTAAHLSQILPLFPNTNGEKNGNLEITKPF